MVSAAYSIFRFLPVISRSMPFLSMDDSTVVAVGLGTLQ